MRTRKFLSTLIPALPMLLTALLVILVTVIFLTAMRSKAHAQFGGVEQPMFAVPATASALPYPQTLTNTMFYWVAADLADGAVATWTDRIQGTNLTQTASSERPTKDATGVFFTGTQILTNAVIPQWFNDTAGGIVLWALVYYTNNAGPTSRTVFGDTATPGMNNQAVSGWWRHNASVFGLYSVVNNYVDFLISQDGVNTVNGFVNNIPLTDGTGARDTWGPGMVMGNYTGDLARPLDAWIVEMAIITNSVTTTLRSNLHYYATNTYLYAP